MTQKRDTLNKVVKIYAYKIGRPNYKTETLPNKSTCKHQHQHSFSLLRYGRVKHTKSKRLSQSPKLTESINSHGIEKYIKE